MSRIVLVLFIVCLLLPLSGCQKRGGGNGDGEKKPQTIDANRGFSEDGLDTVNDVAAYAQFCKKVLDIPPEPLAPFNCIDGDEIPITVDGKIPDAQTYERLKRGDVGCDKPAWLGDEPCANYAFVQKRALTPDVDATLFCRHRAFTTPKVKAERLADYQKDPSFENFSALYDFGSLGLIWTSRKTGHTCFFDFVGRVYGGYVPSPDVTTLPSFDEMPDPKPPKRLPDGMDEHAVWRKNAASTWRAPREVVAKDNCVRCHDAGPYKASPYMEQVFDVPGHDPALPYIVVGKVFASWQTRFPLYAVSTAPIGDEPQVCTTCHRIGAEATCKTFLGYSIGETSSHKLSSHGATFAGRTWMPPVAATWQGSDAELNAQWTTRYGKHVERMLCCCNDPTAKGCTRQALGTSPLGEPQAGAGPNSCL